jgi:hypothetical protein
MARDHNIEPLLLREPEGRPSLHPQRRPAYQTREAPPSRYARNVRRSSRIINVYASFVLRRVMQANSLRRLILPGAVLTCLV